LALLIAAWGVKVFLDPRVRAGVLVLIALFGLVNGIRADRTQRTQAGHVARYIGVEGDPGDVVALCPDQLGPAVMRLLAPGRFAYSFPDASADPQFVDWVDYKKRNEAGDPVAFAKMLHDKAGPHTVWIADSPGYRTFDSKCEELVNAEKDLRSGAAVIESGEEFEHMVLYQFGPGHLKR
jgi:hypothetical protein